MKKERISVCICTYRRPLFLKRNLDHVLYQKKTDEIEYSVVVIDNDSEKSALPIVRQYENRVLYDNEPQQNIALARNRAVVNARNSDYIVFIDDDEFPCSSWLYDLYCTQKKYNLAGVLGPVRPHFDSTPPSWITKSKICERRTFKTGTILDSRWTRTGNVLIRMDVFRNEAHRFNPEFGKTGGEDSDFFRRVINKGFLFVWCNEAVVYEIVPPQRWDRTFYLKRALLRGKTNHIHDRKLESFDRFINLSKSVIKLVLYSPFLPVALLLGEREKMNFLDKYLHHTGRVMAAIGLDFIKDRNQ